MTSAGARTWASQTRQTPVIWIEAQPTGVIRVRQTAPNRGSVKRKPTANLVPLVLSFGATSARL